VFGSEVDRFLGPLAVMSDECALLLIVVESRVGPTLFPAHRREDHHLLVVSKEDVGIETLNPDREASEPDRPHTIEEISLAGLAEPVDVVDARKSIKRHSKLLCEVVGFEEADQLLYPRHVGEEVLVGESNDLWAVGHHHTFQVGERLQGRRHPHPMAVHRGG